tara:strand:+ start:7335 stop:7883 length:549 start_codon:yes stop_codon:yes gene_type:complete
MINKSFSKGDMLELISLFGLDIPNAKTMDKLKLSIILWSTVNNAEHIMEDNEIHMIKGKEDLLEYLTAQNPAKILSVKERNKLMTFCKEVIVYCNNGYVVDRSIFGSMEEIHIQTRDIAIHGDIPSVRRAIKLLNKDTKLIDKIEPIISNKMRKTMEKKNSQKVVNYYGLIAKRGEFHLSFD